MASWGQDIIGGAGYGALAGSAAGPVGAAIGAGLGGLAGLFAAWSESSDEEEKRKILDKAKKEYDLTQDEVEGLLAEYYDNPENFLGTAKDVSAYKKSIADYDPNAFALSKDDVTYKGFGKTVDDFMNPYYDQIIQNTSDKIQHSAAGAGVGRGTGAANAIAEGVAQKQDELYNTALNAYNTNRAQSYSEWAGQIDKMQQRLNALKSATDTKLNMQGNLAQDYTNTQGQRYADQIAAKQERSNGNLQLASMGLMI